MKYRIQMTEKAEDQLRDLMFYIAEDSGSIEMAIKHTDRLYKAIKQLEDFPYLGRVPKYSILRRQGYRVVITDKYMTFYKVNEIKKEVVIYAIINSKREYERLL